MSEGWTGGSEDRPCLPGSNPGLWGRGASMQRPTAAHPAGWPADPSSGPSHQLPGKPGEFRMLSTLQGLTYRRSGMPLAQGGSPGSQSP